MLNINTSIYYRNYYYSYERVLCKSNATLDMKNRINSGEIKLYHLIIFLQTLRRGKKKDLPKLMMLQAFSGETSCL